MLKSEAIALVNALDEKRFDDFEGIAFDVKPTKFEKGLALTALVVCALPMLMLAGALAVDGFVAVKNTAMKTIEEYKARKAEAAKSQQVDPEPKS